MAKQPHWSNGGRQSAKIVPFPRHRHVGHWRARLSQFIAMLGRGAATPGMLGENVLELDWQQAPSGRSFRKTRA